MGRAANCVTNDGCIQRSGWTANYPLQARWTATQAGAALLPRLSKHSAVGTAVEGRVPGNNQASGGDVRDEVLRTMAEELPRRGWRLQSMLAILSTGVEDRASGRGPWERKLVWMGSLRRRGVTLGLLFSLLAATCTSDIRRPTAPATPRLDAQRLEELQLTRLIPEQVGEACAEARQFAMVPVLCPELIPDIPITHMKGSYGAATFAIEPRVYMLSFDRTSPQADELRRSIGSWELSGSQALDRRSR
jgi:hypothetical protein